MKTLTCLEDDLNISEKFFIVKRTGINLQVTLLTEESDVKFKIYSLGASELRTADLPHEDSV